MRLVLPVKRAADAEHMTPACCDVQDSGEPAMEVFHTGQPKSVAALVSRNDKNSAVGWITGFRLSRSLYHEPVAEIVQCGEPAF
jgi:hypothetical protein